MIFAAAEVKGVVCCEDSTSARLFGSWWGSQSSLTSAGATNRVEPITGLSNSHNP